jgi:hypothetical protein
MQDRKKIIQETILNELNRETIERYKEAAKDDLRVIRNVLDRAHNNNRRWVSGAIEDARRTGYKRTRGLVRANRRLRG